MNEAYQSAREQFNASQRRKEKYSKNMAPQQKPLNKPVAQQNSWHANKYQTPTQSFRRFTPQANFRPQFQNAGP